MGYGKSASLGEASLSIKDSWASFFNSSTRLCVAVSGPSLGSDVSSSLGARLGASCIVRSALTDATVRARFRGCSSSSISVASVTALGGVGTGGEWVARAWRDRRTRSLGSTDGAVRARLRGRFTRVALPDATREVSSESAGRFSFVRCSPLAILVLSLRTTGWLFDSVFSPDCVDRMTVPFVCANSRRIFAACMSIDI